MFPGETVLSQIHEDQNTDSHVSPFRVMQSGGGWYVGTMFVACGKTDCKDCQEYVYGDRVLTKGQELDYNSRETDYFESEKEATDALEEFKKSGELPGERY